MGKSLQKMSPGCWEVLETPGASNPIPVLLGRHHKLGWDGISSRKLWLLFLLEIHLWTQGSGDEGFGHFLLERSPTLPLHWELQSGSRPVMQKTHQNSSQICQILIICKKKTQHNTNNKNQPTKKNPKKQNPHHSHRPKNASKRKWKTNCGLPSSQHTRNSGGCWLFFWPWSVRLILAGNWNKMVFVLRKAWLK